VEVASDASGPKAVFEKKRSVPPLRTISYFAAFESNVIRLVSIPLGGHVCNPLLSADNGHAPPLKDAYETLWRFLIENATER
jgi:hypothetical protein